MESKPIRLSIVIPVYNEAGSIGDLFRETKAVCEAGLCGVPFDYEIIIVNDGSDDDTDAVCRTLAPLTYVQLARNSGQTCAMDCGFKLARGEFVAAMDGDGQNDPADIPGMLAYLLENDLDVVSGWRKDRKDPFGKRIASRGANRLRHFLIHDGVNDSGCSLKIYRKSILEGVDLVGEQHRFIPALLKIRGARIGEMPVHHRPRETGRSKYGLSRIFKGFVDLIAVWYWSKFASRPLHLQGFLGVVSFLFSLLFLILTVLRSVQAGAFDTGFFLLTAVCFIAGLQFFAIGLICEMLARIYYDGGRKTYRIRSVERFRGSDGEAQDAREDTDTQNAREDVQDVREPAQE